MVKEIELEASLNILNRVEASGLTCKWNGEFLIIKIDCESTDEILKLAKALDVSGKVTFRTLRMWDNNVEYSFIRKHL